ncbi:MAG: hydantoinase/oxoprolinase family protein, partial [Verrucomicrobiota bacterium]
MSGYWKIFADTGGTFTDCLGLSPQGEECWEKVLSSGVSRLELSGHGHQRRLEGRFPLIPGFFVGCSLVAKAGTAPLILDYDPHGRSLVLDRPLDPGDRNRQSIEVQTGLEAPILGAHLLTRTPLGSPLPPLDFRLATTRGTNALLEEKGVPVAFFVTRGFGDLLRIGDQTRPDLFSLEIPDRRPIYRSVIEVSERIAADGRVLQEPDLDSLETACATSLANGCRTAVVAFLNSYREAKHEEEVASFLRTRGFDHVITSASVSPFIHYLNRAETALADGYLGPILNEYLDQVASELSEGSRLQIMTSAGGLSERRFFHPKDSLLSGPAGGVVGAAEGARRLAWDRVIAFDMGGTSTDVSRISGSFSYRHVLEVGPVRLQTSAVEIDTVAAGGGSLCRLEDGRFLVGPESAGADPGPACYGKGGPLTLTDVHFLLGRLEPSRFAVPLAGSEAAEACDRLLDGERDREAALEGFLRI